MYTRVIRTQIPAEHFDQLLAGAKDTNLPMIKQFPGFKAAYFSADRKTGTLTSVVIFENEEGIRAAELGMEQMRPMVEPLGVRFLSVDNQEVFLEEVRPTN